MLQKLKRGIVEKKIINLTLLVAVYAIVVSFLSIYVYQQLYSAGLCGLNALCILGIPLYYFIPLIAITGFVAGLLMFYMVQEKQKEIQVCKKEEIQKTDELLEKILTAKENTIISLLKEKGELSQSKITKELGLSRVDTFRTIKKLQEKELVEKNKQGKAVKIKLKEI